MPKDFKHIPEAQKQRKKIKERFSKYVPGKVTLQVLGSGANGAPRSLYVFSDQSRYLFNCGEGTQRLAHEHKMKLAKLEHIFITQNVWKNMGGLPGTALTIQDVGVPKITLHGPKGLDELFRATKRFVIMKNMKLEMAECNETFEDNVMSVTYVPLERQHIDRVDSIDETIEEEIERDELDKDIQVGGSTMMDVSTTTRSARKRNRSRSRSRSRSKSLNGSANSSISDDETDYYGHESKKMRHNARNRSRSPSASGVSNQITPEVKQGLIEIKEKGIVMSYICRLTPRPGTLNLDKCVKYGVPPGPLLGQLKNGQDVTLENGTIVKASDVCEPDDPGPVFIVVDCPTEEYLDSLISNKLFQKHQSNATSDDDLAYLIVHFTPNNIMTNNKYKMWMEKFSPSTQHIVINERNSCMGSIAVHRIQHQLNLLNPDFFPLLEENESNPYEEYGLSSLNVIQPKTFGSFHLRPKKGFDSSSELSLEPEEYVAESLAVNGFKTELEKLRLNLAEKKKTLTTNPYPKVLFLGTGSCIPNKTRNTSGILLQTSDKTNIVVDCGEGTYGQIVRFFGQNNSKKILAETDAVYVSHLHADHHIGLIGFLLGRHRARQALGLKQKPVYLFAPKQILSWLHFYDLCFEDISSEYELIPNGDLIMDNHVLDCSKKSQVFESLNMKDISTCFVRHCPNAFGVALTHKLGFKVTYSGDTMPSDNLIELGMDSDLLIHEATMEDELAHEAVIKMHSTTSQAITVGKRMKAKYILLTHFSQRYAKLPRFNDNFTENIGIAFDNMQLRLDELPLVPLLYPALKVMFAEHYEELENKAVKRQLRQEREKEAGRNRSKSPVRPKSSA